MKGFKVAKIVRGIKFEGFWGRLESGQCFRGRPFAGYLGLAVVFVWGGALRGGLHFCFSRVFG